MASFLHNLLRRGAGLAPMVAPRLPSAAEDALGLADVEAPAEAEPDVPHAHGEPLREQPARAPRSPAKASLENRPEPIVVRPAPKPAAQQAETVRARQLARAEQADATPKQGGRIEIPIREPAPPALQAPPVAAPPEAPLVQTLLQPVAPRPPDVRTLPPPEEERPPDRPIQVTIGRIEIRQPSPAPPPRPEPKREAWGFRGDTLARRYLDRRWY